MTYTVKNGTWCKDNEKEYYSTTKTGLKAALKAGEISAGTRVVIHDPKYHTGQLIQSMNPNCPEGCFVPDGSTIDPVYEELIAVVGPNLPDMRECVLVMAGQNEHITTHAHDVFSAGEFKDDCAVEHSHAITITDPGHKHTITVTDPGHGHSVTDPGHTHDVTGSTNAPVLQMSGSNSSNMSNPLETTQKEFIVADITGTAASNTTGISVKNSTTGITANADNNTTGITASCSMTGDSVTRTKQFGVYYYIAF